MTPRTDPDAIYRARRAADFSRLTAPGVIDELDAERALTRWEREAERLGLDRPEAGFWTAGEIRILEQRALERRRAS
jgi:hypothetical protein